MKKLFVLFLLAVASPALAQHAGDIELTVENGVIVTEERVFEAELGEIIPNEVDEPGYDGLAGTFPVGTSVGFTILDSLRKWDGTDFDTVAAETMSISFGSSLGPITTPTVTESVEGFDISAGSDGSWHRHYDFILNSPASTGIYLLTMQVDSTDPSIGSSLPYSIVFNQNASEVNHEAAVSFVENSLSVPEPSSLALVALGLGFAMKRRR